MAVAAMLMLAGWWFSYLKQALVFNLGLWPGREAWQKRNNIKSFFKEHVILEWAAPMVVSMILYGVLR